MIYIITHKVFALPEGIDNHYKILHVGGNDDIDTSYLRDDVGENISNKNKNYCELTGIYWIWKNCSEKINDIVGITHYRRYFTNTTDDLLYTYFGKKPHIIKYKMIENKLKSHDIILPKREKIFSTVSKNYSNVHFYQDLEITRNVLKQNFPEFVSAFDKVMSGHYYYYANMMICRRELFDEYAEWLFDVMCNLEKHIDINKYKDNYQKRVFGFLAERLLQVWVTYKKLNVCELPVFNTDSRRVNIFQKNFSRVKNLFRR